MYLKKFKYKKIVITTHEATTGPAHDLRDYLVPYVKELLFIAHPLLFIPANFKNSSRYEMYKNGQQTKSSLSIHYKLPEIILYLKDIIYSIYWSGKFLGKSDMFIGSGNINALAGLFLKRLGITKKVVFYCIDYIPKRFNSKVLNFIYHYIDMYVTQNSDVTWNLSPRMKEARNKKWGKNLGNQVTVPIGIWYDRIAQNRAKKYNKHEIIYLGTILEKQGLDMCIEAISALSKTIKDIKLTIIGSGPYESVIKAMVKKRKLENRVEFLGYIPDHKNVEKKLSKAALAFALYNPKKDIFSYYADPGKIKSYLACGLPILLTDIPYIAKLVHEKRCGLIVKYDLTDITKTIEDFFKSPKKVDEYKQNAIMFAKKYNWPTVINNAFKMSKL